MLPYASLFRQIQSPNTVDQRFKEKQFRVQVQQWIPSDCIKRASRAIKRAVPCRNDDHREEWCRDNRDRRHDDSSESSRAGQFYQRRPDNAICRRPDVLSKAKSRFNILLNILQSSYIAMMFLRTVFSIFVHQTIFFHVYHLKDDIQLSLRQTPEQSC